LNGATSVNNILVAYPYNVFDVTLLVTIVSLVALYIFYRKTAWTRAIWRTYRKVLPFLVPTVAVTALAVGFWTAPNTTPATLEVTSDSQPQQTSTLRALSAIRTLNLEDSEVNSNLAALGYSAAVLLWVLLGLEVNHALLDAALESGWLRAQKKHAIVCGLGSIGIQIVRDLAKTNTPTVVVEINKNNPHLEEAKDLNAYVLQRDALDDETLSRAGVSRASELFALAGNDSINSGILLRTAAVQRTNRWHLKCYAQVDNPYLLAPPGDLTNEATSTTSGQPLDIEFIAPPHFAAVELITGPLLERLSLARLADEDRHRTLHFVVVGFGPLGQTISRDIGELVHLPNGKRTRLTILYDHQHEARQFQSEYPAFAPDLRHFHKSHQNDLWKLPAEADDWTSQAYAARPHLRSPRPDTAHGATFSCNANFLEMPIDVADDDVIRAISSMTKDDTILPCIIVCTDDDGRNARISERLAQRLALELEIPEPHPWKGVGIPVFVSLMHFGVLHDSIVRHHPLTLPSTPTNERQTVVEIIPFGRIDHVLGHQAITRPEIRTLAMLFAFGFLSKDQQTATSPATHWKTLSRWERHSNISAAAHAYIKSRLFFAIPTFPCVPGHECSLPPADTAPRALSDSMREIAAVAEHNRWVSERLLTGWRYAVSEDDIRKERPQLVPWEQLAMNERQKDIDQVDALYRVLQQWQAVSTAG
jgi:voltage-gated potassium channel Kch